MSLSDSVYHPTLTCGLLRCLLGEKGLVSLCHSLASTGCQTRHHVSNTCSHQDIRVSTLTSKLSHTQVHTSSSHVTLTSQRTSPHLCLHEDGTNYMSEVSLLPLGWLTITSENTSSPHTVPAPSVLSQRFSTWCVSSRCTEAWKFILPCKQDKNER